MTRTYRDSKAVYRNHNIVIREYTPGDSHYSIFGDNFAVFIAYKGKRYEETSMFAHSMREALNKAKQVIG